MAFSNCSNCGKRSSKSPCDECISERKLKEKLYIENSLKKFTKKSNTDFEEAKNNTMALMISPSFLDFEEQLFRHVISEKFLEDCYYQTKLGTNFSTDNLLNLPDIALKNIPDWFAKDNKNKIAAKAKFLHEEICHKEKLAEAEQKKLAKKKKLKEAAETKRLQELVEMQRLKNLELEEKNHLEFQKLKIAKILSFLSTTIIGFFALILSLAAPFGAGLIMGIALPPFIVSLLSQSKIKENYDDQNFEHLYYKNFNLFISISEKWAAKIIEEKNPEWMRSMCLFQYMVFIFIYFPIYFIRISI